MCTQTLMLNSFSLLFLATVWIVWLQSGHQWVRLHTFLAKRTRLYQVYTVLVPGPGPDTGVVHYVFTARNFVFTWKLMTCS